MKKILFTVFMLVLLSQAAFADSVLFVSPIRVYLDEKHKVEAMNLSNMSDITRHYKISIEEYAMSEGGTTHPEANLAYSAKKFLKFYPREVTIRPGESQTVRVMAKIPADTADGQYHAHIKFFEDGKAKEPDNSDGTKINSSDNENKSAMRVGMSYSALMPITVSKGNVDTKVGWTEPQITYDQKSNTYGIKTVVTRQGNGNGVAFFDVIYVGPDGKTKQLGSRRTIIVYREIDKRDTTLPFVLEDSMSKQGKIQVRMLQPGEGKPALLSDVLLAIP